MLPCSGFSNDAGFPHALRQQTLTQRIIDLVRPKMIQVLTLQINLCPTQFFGEVGTIKDRIRAPGEVAK